MNKFTKWMCVIAGIAAGLGVLCVLLSFVMGLTITGFAEMFKRGRFTLAFLGESHVKDDVLRTEEIEEGVVNIDVEFEAGELVFCYGDVRDIQIEYRNAPDLAWTCDEKTLHSRFTCSLHIVSLVVAYHKTILRIYSYLLTNFQIIFG